MNWKVKENWNDGSWCNFIVFCLFNNIEGIFIKEELDIKD